MKLERTMPVVFMLFLALVVLPVQGEPPSKGPVPDTKSSNVGKETCLQCHTGFMAETVHARLKAGYPGIGHLECEACHGSGEKHVSEGGGKGTIAIPDPQKVKANCTACHPKDKSRLAHWKRGAHYQSPEISCQTCHEVGHDVGKNDNFALLKKPQRELCLSCHPDVKAQFERPFHHPIGEGGLECISCHDPHESERDNNRRAAYNDLCMKCHSEVRGPFMWEHKAVTDEGGCLNCHQPHGGSARKLLKQAENQLCIQCHQEQLVVPNYLAGAGGKSRVTTEHSRVPSLQGQCSKCHGTPFSPLVGNHTNSIAATECNICHTSMKGVDHTRFTAEGKCLDCHTDIHGSNHSRAFLD